MKRYFRLAIILPLLALLALSLAAIGWSVQGKRVDDMLFHALHVLAVGGDYDDSRDWPGNGWLHAARWFGLLFFALTALKAYRVLLARQWGDMRAQWAARDLVLIGDDPALAPLVRLLASTRAVLWIADGPAAEVAGAHVVARPWQADFAARYRLARAHAVVVAFASDDLRGLDIARTLAELADNAEIALVTTALARPDGLAMTGALARVRVISRDQLAVRGVHDARPPFAIARALGQDRIHALLIGCGHGGTAVITDLLLSSLTTFLARPRVTIIDPRADAVAAGLAARMPELAQSLDMSFVSASVDDGGDLPADALRSATDGAPFTCAHICLPGDRLALAAAMALDARARREGWPLERIFVRQHSDGAGGRARPDLGRIVPFGGSTDLADALGLLGREPDRLARAIHAAYRSAAPADAPANVDWDRLPESLREANRRAFMHLPAKLASAGVSLDAWSAARAARDPAARLPPFPDLTADAALLDALARLEHERWMADRRSAGWHYAAQRDDLRRVHPDLVPFDQLSARAQGYDVTVVRTLATVLDRDA